MKLTAEVLLRIEGHEELHSIGTIDVPINLTFGDKATAGHKPGYRGGAGVTMNIDEAGLSQNIERATAIAADRGNKLLRR